MTYATYTIYMIEFMIYSLIGYFSLFDKNKTIVIIWSVFWIFFSLHLLTLLEWKFIFPFMLFNTYVSYNLIFKDNK